ncbi:MAG TPA: BMP family ABC transporter substrate-binding protein [Acidimicrobiales bacterium]|jgi:basic membrane protein A
MAMAFSLAASLALVAAACGSDNSSSSSAGNATTTAGATTTAAPGGTTTTAAAGGTTTTAAAGGGGGGTGTCKAGTAQSTPIQTQTGDGKGKSVGLLFDVTGRGDKSFNDGAAAGLDKAKADFGITGNESTPTAQDGSDRPERIKAFVGANNLVSAVGFLWDAAVTASAAANPNQQYSIIDDVVFTVGADGKPTTTPAPNVRSMVFAANQGSFLVGAAAACASKSGKIGFIGGVENDLIKNFEVGFTAGVKQVNPNATVEVKYITQPPDFSGFNDPAKGKSIAKAMYDSGIDVVYAAAGGSGKGMFEAVTETGKKPGEVYAIGVDSDQYQTVSPDQQPFVLTSALKRVDVATYEAIADMVNGKFAGAVKTYDLKNNGVGYAASNKDINKYAGTLDDLKQQIIDGKIKVPSVP